MDPTVSGHSVNVPPSPGPMEPLKGISVFLDSGETPMTRRLFQERIAAVVVLFLLIGFVLQYWIYSQSSFWLEPEGHLGDLLLVTVAIAVVLFAVMLWRWRSLRREYALRSQLDRQLHLLKESVETMDIGITITDIDGRILFVNQAEADMHGSEIGNIVGRRLTTPGTMGNEPGEGFADFLTEGHSKRETIHTRTDGWEFPVQLISNAVLDSSGTPIGIVTSCEDISDRKRTESELVDHRRQLRGLALHLENLRDKERSQIAHEIHNDLGAALTVLKINLALIEGDLARSESEQLDRAHRMSEDIDGMIDLIRSISRQLRPFLLDDVGLNAAVEALAEDLQRKTSVVFDLKLPAAEPVLHAEEKETLFRAFQEGATNCLRHAQATRIWTTIETTDDRITMETTDDGVGLKTDPLKSPSAFGLLGLQERVRNLQGEMTVGPSNHGSGTTLKVTLPRIRGGKR
ncbi:MAG: hypothetical protein DRJ65_10560 [Acidobacteria bacterium]|nr:MAG: hypothetical protein DRJ65_10560 [Acidobacteriota bacterium]